MLFWHISGCPFGKSEQSNIPNTFNSQLDNEKKRSKCGASERNKATEDIVGELFCVMKKNNLQRSNSMGHEPYSLDLEDKNKEEHGCLCYSLCSQYAAEPIPNQRGEVLRETFLSFNGETRQEIMGARKGKVYYQTSLIALKKDMRMRDGHKSIILLIL